MPFGLSSSHQLLINVNSIKFTWCIHCGNIYIIIWRSRKTKYEEIVSGETREVAYVCAFASAWIILPCYTVINARVQFNDCTIRWLSLLDEFIRVANNWLFTKHKADLAIGTVSFINFKVELLYLDLCYPGNSILRRAQIYYYVACSLLTNNDGWVRWKHKPQGGSLKVAVICKMNCFKNYHYVARW